jgi:hypothetical protein
LLIGCTSTRYLAHPAAWGECKSRSVTGIALSCDGNQVARIDCFPRREGPVSGCKSIVIENAAGARTDLYRAGGFIDDAPRGNVSEGYYLVWALYPSISHDGATLWYKDKGVIEASWFAYDFASGRLSETSTEEMWEQIQVSGQNHSAGYALELLVEDVAGLGDRVTQS